MIPSLSCVALYFLLQNLLLVSLHTCAQAECSHLEVAHAQFTLGQGKKKKAAISDLSDLIVQG